METERDQRPHEGEEEKTDEELVEELDEEIEDAPAEGEESGDEDTGAEGAGPADNLQDDPAYNPSDPELKGIKGG